MPLLFALVAAAVPVSASAENTRDIARKMQKMEWAWWNGAQNYVIDQDFMGRRTLLFCEKIEVAAAVGNTYRPFGFRVTRSPPGNPRRRDSRHSARSTPAALPSNPSGA